MSDVLDIKPLSVKAMGRANMACLRCRSQKMKCSKDHPSCKSCLISKKDCRYPVREKKLVLLDSQFQKIQSRVKYLENELRKTREINSPGSTSIIDPIEEGGDEIDGQYEEYIDPFENENLNENNYFGTATCQVFDSSLNSFLFKFTHTQLQDEGSPHHNQNSRYFLQDPQANKPFSGLLMLPDKEYAIFLVQKVIDFLGHEYYFIHPDEFFQKLNDTYDSLLDRDPVWLCYLLVVLAVGEQYLNESSDGDTPGMRFFVPAMQLYRNYYEQPSLELIQTMLLMAFYQQGLNRTNAAFSFYGLALRNSLMMGLHRKSYDPTLTPIDKEKRKRIWWTVFIMDSVWSAKLGQPIHVSIDDTDVELPNTNALNLNDHFDSEIMDSNVRLGVILGKIMRKVYRNNERRGINLKSIIECLDELDYFQKSLPARIKGSLFKSNNRSSANLYLRLNQAVIITTRPLVLSIFKGIYDDNAITRRVIRKCTIAAKTTIDILLNLKNNEWFSRFGFWDAQYCFSSLLILIMSSLSGYQFSQIAIGREINTYMKEAGNFTAMENDMRLKELDDLLERVKQQKMRMHQQDTTAPVVDEQVPQMKRDDISPISALMSEISNNFSSLGDIQIKMEPEQGLQYQNGLELQLTPGILAETPPNLDVQAQLTNGIFNSNMFKNDLSPETWNSLVSNLSFWDSSFVNNNQGS